MAQSNARIAAVETLYQLEKTRKPVSLLFDHISDACSLQGNDRQLAMKITYGVLRNRDYLNRLLDILCNKPVRKIKPFVYQALLSGLYQIFFLDRIPPSAAVNETVKVIKARKLPSQMSGFVNGVLRQSLRQKELLPSPHDLDENNRPILNHPTWLTDRWRRNYGQETMIGICLHNNREPLLCLRAGSTAAHQVLVDYLTGRGVDFEVGAYAPNAVIINDYNGPVSEIPGIGDGLIHVQDQAAQLATMLLAPFDIHHNYLDGCAGLGGKTTHIVELLGGRKTHITAVEPDQNRFRQLQASCTSTLKLSDIHFANQTLQEFGSNCSRRYHRILIDAPCSGTGVIGRHPDIRWNRSEKDLADHRSRQLELLSTAANLAEPDGIIVYATCSIEPEENDRVIARYLAQHPDFFKSDCSNFLPDSCKKFVRNGCFAPLPEHGIDGFFAARLVKRTKDD